MSVPSPTNVTTSVSTMISQTIKDAFRSFFTKINLEDFKKAILAEDKDTFQKLAKSKNPSKFINMESEYSYLETNLLAFALCKEKLSMIPLLLESTDWGLGVNRFHLLKNEIYSSHNNASKENFKLYPSGTHLYLALKHLPEAIPLLIARGADVNSIISNHISFHRYEDSLERSGARASSISFISLLFRWQFPHSINKKEIYSVVANAPGANLHLIDVNGWTPLLNAIYVGEIEAVQFLLSQKVDVHQKIGPKKMSIMEIFIKYELYSGDSDRTWPYSILISSIDSFILLLQAHGNVNLEIAKAAICLNFLNELTLDFFEPLLSNNILFELIRFTIEQKHCLKTLQTLLYFLQTTIQKGNSELHSDFINLKEELKSWIKLAIKKKEYYSIPLFINTFEVMVRFYQKREPNDQDFSNFNDELTKLLSKKNKVNKKRIILFGLFDINARHFFNDKIMQIITQRIQEQYYAHLRKWISPSDPSMLYDSVKSAQEIYKLPRDFFQFLLAYSRHESSRGRRGTFGFSCLIRTEINQALEEIFAKYPNETKLLCDNLQSSISDAKNTLHEILEANIRSLYLYPLPQHALQAKCEQRKQVMLLKEAFPKYIIEICANFRDPLIELILSYCKEEFLMLTERTPLDRPLSNSRAPQNMTVSLKSSDQDTDSEEFSLTNSLTVFESDTKYQNEMSTPSRINIFDENANKECADKLQQYMDAILDDWASSTSTLKLDVSYMNSLTWYQRLTSGTSKDSNNLKFSSSSNDIVVHRNSDKGDSKYSTNT